MREQKRIRDLEKDKKRKALTGGDVGEGGRQNISNAFIDKILNDEPLYPETEQSMDQSQIMVPQIAKEELKIAPYVIEMDIPPPVSSLFRFVTITHRKNQLHTTDPCSAISLINPK